MELASGRNSIKNLEEFLIKTGIESTSMPFSMVFNGLKYDWGENLGLDDPKTLDEFLKTSLYNAAARRIGLKHQANDPLSGQPGLEIGIRPQDVADGFHIEVYHWESKAGSPPEPLNQKVATLTGVPSLDGEKFTDYARRLDSENKATFREVNEDNKDVRIFESPVEGIPDFKVEVRIDGKKTEKGYGVSEISLDIKVPYQEIGNWLSPQQN